MDEQAPAPTVQQAIETIMYCAKEYKVKFKIEHGSNIQNNAGGRYRTNDGNSAWRITVMTRIFIDMDFIKCCQEACKFVYNVNEADPL